MPTSGKLFGFWGGGTDVVIPWRNIVKIGMDVVLVKLDDTRMYRGEEEGREQERDRDREYSRGYYRDR
ncbi:hypothetical protein D3C71_2113040 [compost metagenome]